MAESEHDDLADALARMAAGDIAPSEHEPAAPPPPPKTRVVKPVTNRPATVKPASSTPSPKLPPATPAAPRPEAPVRARPAAPSLGNASPPPRAAAPAPAQAPAPVAAPVARKPRPAAPTTRSVTVPTEQAPPETDGAQSTELSAGAGAGQVGDGQVIDDDDAMLAPAPDPSVFEYRSKTTAEARAKVARQKNLNFRRTLIPILLTCGMLLIGFASLKFLSGQDSGLSAWPIWIPGILVFMAVVLLSLAVVNMISVAKQQGRDA